MDDVRHISSRLTPLWLALGIVAEAAALAALAPPGFVPVQWLHGTGPALALHIASALAFGAFAAEGEIMSRPLACATACVFAFTAPVLGALGVCAVLSPAFRARRADSDDGVIDFEPGQRERGADEELTLRPAAAPIEVTLRGQAAVSQRVASVLALRHMDAQRAVPLLRVALADQNEDVRLLAYALLERREKELRGAIEELLGALAELPQGGAEPARRGLVLRRLAEQTWELVHGGFVGGDLEVKALTETVRFGHESLLLAPDGSLSLLLARARMRRGDAASALRYLRAASALGVATSVLAPLYAEAAFLLRRFDAVAPLLAEAGDALARPRLAAVAQFWNGRPDA